MIPDIHIHTYLCHHAEGQPQDYLAYAETKSIPAICFTDHAPTPHNYDVECRMSMDDFPFYQKMIKELKSSRTKVLIGIEADYYPGAEKFLSEWLPKQKLDLVIGSVHYINDWGFDNPKFADRWKKVDVEVIWEKYFELLCKLVDLHLFDIVGHLDVTKRFGFKPSTDTIKQLAGKAMDKIAKAKMAIEINTSGLRRPVGEIYPSADLLKMARERNIPIVFGSDAHKPDEVGYAFDKAIELAKNCGYNEMLIFNNRQAEPLPLPG